MGRVERIEGLRVERYTDWRVQGSSIVLKRSPYVPTKWYAISYRSDEFAQLRDAGLITGMGYNPVYLDRADLIAVVASILGRRVRLRQSECFYRLLDAPDLAVHATRGSDGRRRWRVYHDDRGWGIWVPAGTESHATRREAIASARRRRPSIDG